MLDPDGRNTAARDDLRRLAQTEQLPLHVLPLDVTSEVSVDAFVRTAQDIGGRIDVLVNNAGLACFGVTEAFTVEQVMEQFATNAFGELRMNRAVLPHM